MKRAAAVGRVDSAIQDARRQALNMLGEAAKGAADADFLVHKGAVQLATLLLQDAAIIPTDGEEEYREVLQRILAEVVGNVSLVRV